MPRCRVGLVALHLDDLRAVEVPSVFSVSPGDITTYGIGTKNGRAAARTARLPLTTSVAVFGSCDRSSHRRASLGRRAVALRRMATPWDGASGTAADATSVDLVAAVGLAQRRLHPWQRRLGVVAALVVAFAARARPPRASPGRSPPAAARATRAPPSRLPPRLTSRRPRSRGLIGAVRRRRRLRRPSTACRPTPRCRRRSAGASRSATVALSSSISARRAVESLVAVGARHRHDDGDVADGQRSPTRWTAAMDSDVELRRRSSRPPRASSGLGGRVARSSRGRRRHLPWSWSRTVPTKSAIPPASGSRIA